MATAITVRGRQVTRPGAYSEIRSGIKNPAIELSYGNICIIDDGLGAGFGGGAGITGTLTTDPADAIYYFKTIQDYRDFVKGGPLWDIAEPLFKPDGVRNAEINGVSTIYLIRAAETVNAAMTKTFTNGSLVINTLDEGLNANGSTTSGELTKGYGMKLSAGIVDPAKYILKIYVGTYKGDDPLNGSAPYDSIVIGSCRPSLIVQSPEVSTILELAKWAQNNFEFNQYFRYVSHVPGAIVVGDINTTYTLAVGGTESYTADAFDKAILQVKNLDNAFFLATQYGEQATGANNFKILDFLQNDAKYEKAVFIAGGADSTKFDSGIGSSIDTAQTYDSDKVVVIHGQAKKTARVGSTPASRAGNRNPQSGFVIKSQLYKAAAVLGRTCGLEPQTPITLKGIDIQGDVHNLSEPEQEYALSQGLLYTYYDYELGKYVIGQGINTLLNNSFLVNEDGTSFSIAVKRITGQLNKEIIYNAKRKFFGGNSGPNRNTISSAEIKAWLEGFLQDKIATTLNDNLLIRFGNVVVTVSQDNYLVSYEFVPNFEVSKIVFTGFILEK